MGKYNIVGARQTEELAATSQNLIEAAFSGDRDLVPDCLMLKTVDFNYIGTLSLRVKYIEPPLREEESDETEIQFRDFVTVVTPLFAASYSGHVEIARKLLSAGADVNSRS